MCRQMADEIFKAFRRHPALKGFLPYDTRVDSNLGATLNDEYNYTQIKLLNQQWWPAKN